MADAVPTADFGGSGTGWTYSSGTTLWNLIDDNFDNDADYGQVTNDGISESFTKIVTLTKDVGSAWSAAQVKFRAKAASDGNTIALTLYANDGSTVIQTYTQALTTSFATYTLTALDAGDLTAFNAAANPKLEFSGNSAIPSDPIQVSAGRVTGTAAAGAASMLPVLGVGCLAPLVAIFGPWFQSKSNQLRAYPGCAL